MSIYNQSTLNMEALGWAMSLELAGKNIQNIQITYDGKSVLKKAALEHDLTHLKINREVRRILLELSELPDPHPIVRESLNSNNDFQDPLIRVLELIVDRETINRLDEGARNDYLTYMQEHYSFHLAHMIENLRNGNSLHRKQVLQLIQIQSELEYIRQEHPNLLNEQFQFLFNHMNENYLEQLLLENDLTRSVETIIEKYSDFLTNDDIAIQHLIESLIGPITEIGQGGNR